MKKKVIIFLIILGLLMIVCLYEPIFQEIIPITRTSFKSYEEFEAKAEYNQYFKSLPESAKDFKYYFYEGALSDMSAYHVAYNSEDYDSVKKGRMIKYESENNRGGYCYEDGDKLYLNVEMVEQQKIDFIYNVLPNNTYENFYFLAYRVYKGPEEFFCYGVLCNDDTCEMVEYTCRICGSF